MNRPMPPMTVTIRNPAESTGAAVYQMRRKTPSFSSEDIRRSP